MPDIESPETVPVYLTAVEPTVPNLIEPPSTVPFTGTVPDVDSVILPCSFDPACSQLSVNVPENVPPYVPVHLPDRPPDCCDVEPPELELDGMVDGRLAPIDGTDDGADAPPPPPQPVRATARATATPSDRATVHGRW